MRALVTGMAGSRGPHLAAPLEGGGANVVGVDGFADCDAFAVKEPHFATIAAQRAWLADPRRHATSAPAVAGSRDSE
jgi:nucleoside-diphosphate-sugar epimerase